MKVNLVHKFELCFEDIQTQWSLLTTRYIYKVFCIEKNELDSMRK